MINDKTYTLPSILWFETQILKITSILAYFLISSLKKVFTRSNHTVVDFENTEQLPNTNYIFSWHSVWRIWQRVTHMTYGITMLPRHLFLGQQSSANHLIRHVSVNQRARRFWGSTRWSRPHSQRMLHWLRLDKQDQRIIYKYERTTKGRDKQ